MRDWIVRLLYRNSSFECKGGSVLLVRCRKLVFLIWKCLQVNSKVLVLTNPFALESKAGIGCVSGNAG